MAITQQRSTQVANSTAVPVQLNPTTDAHGRARAVAFDFTQATANGDAGSLAELADLPAGTVRLLEIVTQSAAMGSSRTMDLGFLAHQAADGSAVAADPDAFAADLSVASAATLRTVVNQLLDSRSGIRLTAQINDGTLDTGKTIKGYALYVVD